jgi:hypothetical protein
MGFEVEEKVKGQSSRLNVERSTVKVSKNERGKEISNQSATTPNKEKKAE